MPRRLASYADLEAWAGTLADGYAAAVPDDTRLLLVDMCRSFADKLDAVQLRCLAAAGRLNEQTGGQDREDWRTINRRVDREAPRLVPEARLPSIVHLPPDQARNRLVFAACVTNLGPLDWQLGEYLVLWAEDAEIPIDQCVEVFRAHVSELRA